ncbi:MAG: ribonuclease P protein subunit [Nitrososphaeraceae archaeon]
MINDKDIFAHELVGLQARIEESSDRSLIGLSGMIILETKNMISINTGTGVKHISKLVARKLQLCLPLGSCFINGSSLIGRPEDRVTTLY